MIRLAEPAYNVVARVLPAKWITKLERNTSEEAEEHETDEMRLLWRTEFRRYILILLINSVLCLAIIAIMYYYGAPLIYGWLPNPWSGIVTAFITLSACGPFLWSLMRQGGNSDNVNRLWYEGRRIERVKITAFAILRLVIAAAIIAYIIGNTLPMIGMYGIFAVIAVACYIFMSPSLEKHSDSMTKTFTDNLNKRV
jgi:CPA2 family monovalent cation:H+ antiporter-2